MPHLHHLYPRAGALAVALALAALPLTFAQSSEPAITLVKTQPAEPANPPRAAALAQAAGYRHFGRIKVGQSSQPEIFLLNFHQTTTITAIAATNDFRVSGGSCLQRQTYLAGDLCSVELIFTPQGPGHRTGTLKVSHTASAQPLLVPAGGDADGPAVSFIPSQIATLSTTLVSGVGLLLNAQGLAIDGGDNLFIADTGNELIRYQDSSGVLSVLAGGGTNPSPTYTGSATGVELNHPYGIATDSIGDAWISDTGNDVVRVVGPASAGLIETEVGGGTGSPTYPACSPSSPCSPTEYVLPAPYGIALDPSGNLFVNVNDPSTFGFGAQMVESADALIFDDALSYIDGSLDDLTDNYPIAVDSSDDVYFAYELPAIPSDSVPPQCTIIGQNQAFSDNSPTGEQTWKVAGTDTCGFSGDGGLANGAEISSSVQGFAFDAAGNFYFTDTGNNRVRRIDGLTGIIRTVAGDGKAADTGDDGASTSAAVWAPTGIAADSMGNVYTIAVQKQTGNESFGVVRKFGATGKVTFPSSLIGAPSAAQTILVSNVGNDTLTFTREVITSGNAGDFAIDPDTTSCNFTQPLASGRNCLIGIIFTPGASGARSSTLKLLDNTVSGSNLIKLSGTGATAAQPVISPTTLILASEVAGNSSAATAVKLSNTGGLSLTIKSYTFTGANPGDFSQTHTCGAKLAGGASCTINLKFEPVAPGSLSATLSVSTSAGKVSVKLSGTATAAIESPPANLN